MPHAVFIGCLLSAPLDAEQRESDRLQGTWNLVSCRLDGRPVPPTRIEDVRMTVRGYRWSRTRGRTVLLEGIYRLDPQWTPPEIDLTMGGGLDVGRVLQGVYALEGDRWTLCVPHLGRERPTKITAGPGTDVEVWERFKRREK